MCRWSLLLKGNNRVGVSMRRWNRFCKSGVVTCHAIGTPRILYHGTKIVSSQANGKWMYRPNHIYSYYTTQPPSTSSLSIPRPPHLPPLTINFISNYTGKSVPTLRTYLKRVSYRKQNVRYHSRFFRRC